MPEMITGPFKSQIPSPSSRPTPQQQSIAMALINNVISRFIGLYGTFSSLQFLSLKQSLYLYFQGKKIKISLFLQQNIQDHNGNFLFTKNPKLPYGTGSPGKIISYDHNRNAASNTFVTDIGDSYNDNHNEILDKSSSLGFNIFDTTSKPPPIIFESSLELEKVLAANFDAKALLSPTINNDRIPRKAAICSSKGINIMHVIIIMIIIITCNN